MAVVKVVESGSVPWILTSDVAGPTELAKLSEGERSSGVRMHHPGSDDELQLFEVRIDPSVEFGAHAHAEDEVIYVLGGELHLGRRILTPGASLYVPGWTLYSFRSGPQGVHFLNFRARKDLTYITKTELVDERRSHGAQVTNEPDPGPDRPG